MPPVSIAPQLPCPRSWRADRLALEGVEDAGRLWPVTGSVVREWATLRMAVNKPPASPIRSSGAVTPPGSVPTVPGPTVAGQAEEGTVREGGVIRVEDRSST